MRTLQNSILLACRLSANAPGTWLRRRHGSGSALPARQSPPTSMRLLAEAACRMRQHRSAASPRRRSVGCLAGQRRLPGTRTARSAAMGTLGVRATTLSPAAAPTPVPGPHRTAARRVGHSPTPTRVPAALRGTACRVARPRPMQPSLSRSWQQMQRLRTGRRSARRQLRHYCGQEHRRRAPRSAGMHGECRRRRAHPRRHAPDPRAAPRPGSATGES